MCMHTAPGQTHCYVGSWWEGKGVLHLQHGRGVCGWSLCVSFRALCTGPRGLTILRLILLCLFSSWPKCCPIQSYVCCVFLGNSNTCKLQWVCILVLLLLVAGNRCHLLDSSVHWAKSPAKYTMAWWRHMGLVSARVMLAPRGVLAVYGAGLPLAEWDKFDEDKLPVNKNKFMWQMRAEMQEVSPKIIFFNKNIFWFLTTFTLPHHPLTPHAGSCRWHLRMNQRSLCRK